MWNYARILSLNKPTKIKTFNHIKSYKETRKTCSASFLESSSLRAFNDEILDSVSSAVASSCADIYEDSLAICSSSTDSIIIPSSVSYINQSKWESLNQYLNKTFNWNLTFNNCLALVKSGYEPEKIILRNSIFGSYFSPKVYPFFLVQTENYLEPKFLNKVRVKTILLIKF